MPVGRGKPLLARFTLPITSPLPAVGVELFWVSVKAPVLRLLVSVSVPLTFVLMPSVTPAPALAMVRLSNVVEVLPPIVCRLEPLKFTVSPLAVNDVAAPPLLVQLPLTFMIVPFVPASVAPLSICTLLSVVLVVKMPFFTSSSPCTTRPLKPVAPTVLLIVRLL